MNEWMEASDKNKPKNLQTEWPALWKWIGKTTQSASCALARKVKHKNKGFFFFLSNTGIMEVCNKLGIWFYTKVNFSMLMGIELNLLWQELYPPEWSALWKWIEKAIQSVNCALPRKLKHKNVSIFCLVLE